MTTPVGVQLWTLRNECERDFFGTLEHVAQAGYRWIEPFQFYDADIHELARVLKDNGLGLISSHVSLDRLEGELDRVMDEHEALGCKHIVAPWLSEERRQAPDLFESLGRSLNLIGEKLRARGFTLEWHNHDFEFGLVKNPDGIQRILANSKPENLTAQLDTFWVSYSGIEPVGYMKQLGPRLTSVHLKDGFPHQEKFTPVGKGSIDMPAVIRAGREMGVRAFVVEQDECEGSVFDAIRESLDFLRSHGL